jgi:ribosomal protein L24
MSHDSPVGVQARRSAGQIEIGDTIHITHGALKGIVGVVASFTTNDQCVIKVDELAEGVLIVVGQDAVVRVREQKTVER